MSSINSHSQSIQENNGATASTETTEATYSRQSNISYRENRRLQQSHQSNDKKTRGRTRAIKWKNERKRMVGVKPSCQITKDMKRIVGEKASQFITEVGHWLRNFLSLRCRKWKDMDDSCKERLYKKITAEWNMPEGDYVERVVESQCMALYRQWRYRLKDKYFNGFSIAEALKNCPNDVKPDEWRWLVKEHWGSEKQKRISRSSRTNRGQQKVKGRQGSSSTARILEMLRKTRQLREQATQNTEEGNEALQEDIEVGSEPPLPPEPDSVKLWELTKRSKDKTMDKFAEEKLEEFKQLHEEQLKLYGVDSLTVEEAYMKMLGTCSGYINGLGFGPKPPKGLKRGRSDEEYIPLAHQMAEQLEQVEINAREREAQLQGKIEELQKDKAKMLEDIEKMKADFQALQEQLLSIASLRK